MYELRAIELKNGSPHPNADRLKIWKTGGDTLITDFSYEEGEVVIYFPEEGVLHSDFAKEHNLVKNIDPETQKNIGGMFDTNRRVRPISIRGVKTSGFVMKNFTNLVLQPNQTWTAEDDLSWVMIEGKPIAKKFLREEVAQARHNMAKQKREEEQYNSKWKYTGFREHFDTVHWKGVPPLKHKDVSEIFVTEKIHGTSGRTGYTKSCRYVKNNLTLWQKIKKLFGFLTKKEQWALEEKYQHVSGTRRTVLNTEDPRGGFFGTQQFRIDIHNYLKDHLKKGETIYYEIYGWTETEKPISSPHDLKKIKELPKLFGKTTEDYSYGIEKRKWDFAVYRITQEQVDGSIKELTFREVENRCKVIGCKVVPLISWGINLGDIQEIIDDYEKEVAQFSSLSDKTVMEGLIIRIEKVDGTQENYKHKFHNFKVLEHGKGIDQEDVS